MQTQDEEARCIVSAAYTYSNHLRELGGTDLRKVLRDEINYQLSEKIGELILSDYRPYYVVRLDDQTDFNSYPDTTTIQASCIVVLLDGYDANVGEFFKNLPNNTGILVYDGKEVIYRLENYTWNSNDLKVTTEVRKFVKVRFRSVDFWKRVA